MENIITVQNFSKYFNEKQVIKDISFSVKKWEIFAYLWVNWSWKTTTIRSLLDIYKPDAWQLSILWWSFSEKIFDKIWYLPEERWLYMDENVFEILYYFAKLRWLSTKQAKENIDKYLQKVDLIDKKFTKLKKLSSWQQQKIQFWVAVIHNPEILILDEPMKWLDPINRQLFIDMILEQKAKWTTILFSSHQMDDVEKMADSLIILKNWQIWAYGKVSDVKKNYWQNTIKVNFEGTLPENKNFFEINFITNNFAELKPKNNISSNEILKFFLENNLIINKFEFSESSLNDIFISINKKND